ncbi:MAG: sulfite exporter TauE/SafE family protein, partial [Sphingobium sp.]
LLHLGWETFTNYPVGLLIGGVVAAPFGAMLARHVAPKILLSAVGIILTLTSAFGITKALGLIG